MRGRKEVETAGYDLLSGVRSGGCRLRSIVWVEKWRLQVTIYCLGREVEAAGYDLLSGSRSGGCRLRSIVWVEKWRLQVTIYCLGRKLVETDTSDLKSGGHNKRLRLFVTWELGRTILNQ
ncbi:hypothetical protein RRG08_024762 [Elysia crispata]|uniref:Uncharacterized protein n=1 Tax=Elysia crispata TaxID=231223 RepID=A0AAE0Y5X4_9GAST|nr:hypothetical protein RRG08_024762 [Elysia crispata]